MTDMLINLAAAMIAGMSLGVFYFGTLWFTVRRFAESRHPMGFLLGSYAVRLLVILGCFYLLVQGHWSRPVMALLGFVVMRGMLIRKWAMPLAKVNP